jgi:hypothetical protein
MRLKEPEPFTGDHSKFEEFVSKVTLHVTANPDVFHNDTRKCIFLVNLMRDDAGKWVKPWIDSLQSASPAPEMSDFVRLTAALRLAFGPVNAQGEAQRKLSQLRQTSSVVTYAADFRTYKADAGWGDNQQLYIDRFHNGLRDSIKDKLLGFQNLPTTLDEYIALCTRVDQQLQARAEERRAEKAVRPLMFGMRQGFTPDNRTSFPMKPVQNPNPAVAPRRDPNAMEVDVLTQQERERRLKARTCFSCNQPGHMARDCQTRPPRAKISEIRPSETPPTSQESVPTPPMPAPSAAITPEHLAELTAAIKALTARTTEMGFE